MGCGEAEAFQVGPPLFGGSKSSWEKAGEGNAVVGDNSLIQRVAAVAEDSHLTLDAEVYLRAYCIL